MLPDGRPIPCVLLGNKCDQPATGPADSEAAMDAFSKDNSFAGWFNVSAKENTNVEEAAKFLVEKVPSRFKNWEYRTGVTLLLFPPGDPE